MYRLFVISFVLIFSLVGVLPASERKPQRQRNRPPIIESFTPSRRVVEICPFLPSLLTIGEPVVDLWVDAKDPDSDSLSYEYLVTEGSISGKGSAVVWNLDRLPRGLHEVRVTVTDGKGGKADAVLTVRTVDSGSCDRPPPPCPVVKVSSP